MIMLRLFRSRSRLLVVTVICVAIVFTAKHALNQGFNFYGDATDTIKFTGEGLNDISGGSHKVSPPSGIVQQFWGKVFEVFDRNALNITDPKGAIQYIEKSKQKEGPNSKEVLLLKAFISDDTLAELKLKHENTIRELPAGLADVTFKAGSSGVVLVGGGRFSWLSYLSLVALRESGSLLPVEIMLPTYKDYEKEKQFCNEVLPALDASCVIIPEVLGASVMSKWAKKLANYQFKSLALITSSFQNVLLLDSDNIVVQNPDSIFESSVYKEYGMITWPDYWERTISPHFYDIANVDVNELKRVRYNRFPLNVALTDRYNLDETELEQTPFHDLDGAIPNLSTESGQLVVNKATHGKSMLLSLYYNIYGPSLYYKLFSLGEQGEGDKDTFVAAATVVRQKYYQVKSYIKTFGYADGDGKFQGVAMGQKNPVADYEEFDSLVVSSTPKNLLQPLKDQIEALQKILKDSFDNNNQVPLFTVHCNYPKLDPLDLKQRDNLYDQNKKQLKYRLYGGLKYPKTYDVGGQPTSVEIDFELEQWKTMQKVLCKEKIYFTHFERSDKPELCQFVNNQVKWLSKPNK